ncbi:hypothetical protein D3C71_2064090 [compost metagenome]
MNFVDIEEIITNAVGDESESGIITTIVKRELGRLLDEHKISKVQASSIMLIHKYHPHFFSK